MYSRIIIVLLMAIGLALNSSCQNPDIKSTSAIIDPVSALQDTLTALSDRSDNAYFKMHFNSMMAVIQSGYHMNARDSSFLSDILPLFSYTSDPANGRDLSTYLNRKRPFIISWISPTDGTVSFSWLNLPKDWDPSKKYPLYVNLHGLWSVASNTLEYMTYPYRTQASSNTSFEDGYLLSPWGRGNLWYQGISETDIWECIHALEQVVHIEPSRRYLSGHSMGGYGAWSIASKSAGYWAALGIMAGALWYYPDLLTPAVADLLKDLPTYFVCGTKDDLLQINQAAFELLESAGNWHMQFITFNGGHEYTEANARNMYLWMRQYVNRDLISKDSDLSGTLSSMQVACYPNPLNNEGIIRISEVGGLVSVNLYDLTGRMVRKIGQEIVIQGERFIPFSAQNLDEGVYILRLTGQDHNAEIKVVVSR